MIGNPRQCHPRLRTTDLCVATKARGILDFCQSLVVIEQTTHDASLEKVALAGVLIPAVVRAIVIT